MKKILTVLTFSLYSITTLAITPNPYYLVADDYIAPHMVGAHEDALIDFKNKADDIGYNGSWLFYSFDDGRHMAFSKKEQQDYKEQDDKDWQAVANKFPKGFLQENGSIYSKTITNQDFYLMRYLADLSYDSNRKTKEQPSKHIIWLELEMHRVPVKEHIKNWVEKLKKTNSHLRFSIYSKQFGANLPTIFIVFHTDSLPDFYKMMEQKGIHDPLRLLPKYVYQGVEKYRVSLAKYLPTMSY